LQSFVSLLFDSIAMFRSLTAVLALVAATVTALPAELSKRADGARSVMYIQTFKTSSGGKLSLLPLIQQNTQVTHVYLSALHINAQPGDITLNDNSPDDAIYDTVWSEAAQLQQKGVKVMMMMGGSAPGSYPRLCSGPNGAINNDFYGPLLSTIKSHKVDGLDLDIEESIPLSCPLNLLRRLNSDLGPSFILTLAPVASDLTPREIGLGGFSYSQLDRQATAAGKPNGKLVNWYNAQFYNGWGDSSSPAGYNSIVSNGYAASRVVMGVLANPNDGGSGWYGISTYQKTISSLKAKYGNDFGSVVGWEYWDAGEKDSPALKNYQWVQTIAKSIFPGNSGARDATPTNTTEPAVPGVGEVPWPGLLDVLMGKGAGDLEGLRALNQTDGDLPKAADLLGLGELIGGLVDTVGDVVDGIL